MGVRRRRGAPGRDVTLFVFKWLESRKVEEAERRVEGEDGGGRGEEGKERERRTGKREEEEESGRRGESREKRMRGEEGGRRGGWRERRRGSLAKLARGGSGFLLSPRGVPAARRPHPGPARPALSELGESWLREPVKRPTNE